MSNTTNTTAVTIDDVKDLTRDELYEFFEHLRDDYENDVLRAICLRIIDIEKGRIASDIDINTLDTDSLTYIVMAMRTDDRYNHAVHHKFLYINNNKDECDGYVDSYTLQDDMSLVVLNCDGTISLSIVTRDEARQTAKDMIANISPGDSEWLSRWGIEPCETTHG